jgi:hypothetical protein
MRTTFYDGYRRGRRSHARLMQTAPHSFNVKGCLVRVGGTAAPRMEVEAFYSGGKLTRGDQ